jgi:hypothetical protein
MRAKIKRRACIQQLKAHCDIALIQDTHADEIIMKEIEKEFSLDWFSSHCTNCIAGVAIFIPTTTIRIKIVEKSLYTDDSGRLIGLGITKNNHRFLSNWSMCPILFASRKANATFSQQVSGTNAREES